MTGSSPNVWSLSRFPLCCTLGFHERDSVPGTGVFPHYERVVVGCGCDVSIVRADRPASAACPTTNPGSCRRWRRTCWCARFAATTSTRRWADDNVPVAVGAGSACTRCGLANGAPPRLPVRPVPQGAGVSGDNGLTVRRQLIAEDEVRIKGRLSLSLTPNTPLTGEDVAAFAEVVAAVERSRFGDRGIAGAGSEMSSAKRLPESAASLSSEDSR